MMTQPRLLIAILAATAALSGPAMAADFGGDDALRPSVDETVSDSNLAWQGAYVGANLGGRFEAMFDKADVVYRDRSARLTGTGAAITGGVEVGFDQQVDDIIYGITTDIAAAGKTDKWRGSHYTPAFYPEPPFRGYRESKSDLEWFGTLRGRLGYVASDQFMAYITGGLAYGGISTHSRGRVAPDYPVIAYSWQSSKSYNSFGWVVGAGAEYALGNNLSVTGEYLHINLGEKYVWEETGGSQFGTSVDVARLGLKYRFK